MDSLKFIHFSLNLRNIKSMRVHEISINYFLLFSSLSHTYFIRKISTYLELIKSIKWKSSSFNKLRKSSFTHSNSASSIFMILFWNQCSNYPEGNERFWCVRCTNSQGFKKWLIVNNIMNYEWYFSPITSLQDEILSIEVWWVNVLIVRKWKLRFCSQLIIFSPICLWSVKNPVKNVTGIFPCLFDGSLVENDIKSDENPIIS